MGGTPTTHVRCCQRLVFTQKRTAHRMQGLDGFVRTCGVIVFKINVCQPASLLAALHSDLMVPHLPHRTRRAAHVRTCTGTTLAAPQ